MNGVPAGQSDEKLFDRYRELIERVAAAKHAAGSADRIIRVDDLLPPIIDDGCVRPHSRPEVVRLTIALVIGGISSHKRRT